MMNDIQKRMMEVLHNIGGVGAADTIRTQGNIPKTLDVMETNLRQMQKMGRVKFSKGIWSVVRVKPKPAKQKMASLVKNVKEARESGPLITVGAMVTHEELEDAVKNLDDEIEQDMSSDNIAVTTQMQQRIEDLRSQVKFLEGLVSDAYSQDIKPRP
jgi:hypothetical protein